MPAAFVGGSEILTRFLRPVRREVFARPSVAVAAVALLLLLPAAAGAGSAVTGNGPVSLSRPHVTGAVPRRQAGHCQAGALVGHRSHPPQLRLVPLRHDGQRAASFLNGVTGKSRTLGPKDVGHTLSLAVRATDSSGTTTAYASLLGPVEAAGPSPFSTAQPALSGSGETGSTLTVGPGGWHPRPGSLSYQWVRCDGKGRSCAPIGGATGATHEVSPDDLGHTLVAIVDARSGAPPRPCSAPARSGSARRCRCRCRSP